MRNWKGNSNGFTLITTLLLLFLLSGLAIGMLMMVRTEVKVGTQDVQNNVTFHAAEGAIEKMTADLANTLSSTLAPTPADITSLATSPGPPTLTGITYPNPGAAYPNGGYTFTPLNPVNASGNLVPTPGVVPSGNYAGLNAQLINVQLQATAQGILGDEVSMNRTVEIALIPVFQFGIFCDGDCGFFAGPNFDFAGRVHANGDLYLAEGTGDTLTFHSQVSAYGNVIRQVLSNGVTIASGAHTGAVMIPTAAAGCDGAQPACRAMAATEGSVVNGPTSAYTTGPPSWLTISETTYAGQVTDGDYGNTVFGTGATDLTLPFVNGTTGSNTGPQNYEIVRRPPAGESTTSPLGASRLYNIAQIRVLLSDNPNELPCGNPSTPPPCGGSADTQNIRLANIKDNDNAVDYSHGVSQTSMAKLADGGYPTMYFATANSAVPDQKYWSGSVTTLAPDWAFGPLYTFPSQTIWDTNLDSVVGSQAPYMIEDTGSGKWYAGKTSPQPATLVQCAPPAAYAGKTTWTTTAPAPPTCPDVGAYPYYSINGWPVGQSATDPALSLPFPYASPQVAPVPSVVTVEDAPATGNQSSWDLIDGYLRVEYRDANGNYHPVTQEWLALGFARGLQPPTTIGGNGINPNAILLLQQPADRYGTGNLDAKGAAPTFSLSTTKVGATTDYTYTLISGMPPVLTVDSKTSSPYFGDSTQAGGVTVQSPSQYNWYPINFYDVREGEVRDVATGDSTCTPNGVMNAVELDVGNLQQWLKGKTGVSGALVESQSQNGYILYFSDRRGMEPNPNGTQVDPVNTKTGDAGLEDVVNSASATGTPDGKLEPDAPGKNFSPEDFNLNGALDNFGAADLGLGFGYNNLLPPPAAGIAGGVDYTKLSNTTAINYLANAGAGAVPDPYIVGNRINNCSVGQGNWVSGARHVLKLVDGTLGNLPLAAAGAGGFSVGSENPVYINGDYNSNAGDPTWGGGADAAGEAAAGVIADAVTFLSDGWQDWNSILTQPTNQAGRTATTSYYRVAIAAGKNINFPNPAGTNNDFGTDGGVHNFLRYLENWGGQTLNYKGSIANLYYATYGTGVYKCCNIVYSPPTRNYSFDSDFTLPTGIPPGTPEFRDIDNLSYRQSFTPCTVGAGNVCTN
jgi:hypothetical protein